MAAALAFQENSLYNKKQYARFGPGGTAFAARIDVYKRQVAQYPTAFQHIVLAGAADAHDGAVKRDGAVAVPVSYTHLGHTAGQALGICIAGQCGQ